MTQPVFKCGHPRSPNNIKRVRSGEGIACRICFKEHNRTYVAAKRAALKKDEQ